LLRDCIVQAKELQSDVSVKHLEKLLSDEQTEAAKGQEQLRDTIEQAKEIASVEAANEQVQHTEAPETTQAVADSEPAGDSSEKTSDQDAFKIPTPLQIKKNICGIGHEEAFTRARAQLNTLCSMDHSVDIEAAEIAPIVFDVIDHLKIMDMAYDNLADELREA